MFKNLKKSVIKKIAPRRQSSGLLSNILISSYFLSGSQKNTKKCHVIQWRGVPADLGSRSHCVLPADKKKRRWHAELSSTPRSLCVWSLLACAGPCFAKRTTSVQVSDSEAGRETHNCISSSCLGNYHNLGVDREAQITGRLDFKGLF